MTREIIAKNELDFETQGRRDYYVKVEQPTIWGQYLIPVTVIVGPNAEAGKGVVAIGSTPGNEYEGPVAIKHLLKPINTADVLGRIILIPVLNISAFKAGKRDTPEDGKNLNREFPGDANGTITQKFADIITTYIFPQVHVVLDLHAGGLVCRFPETASFHHVEDEEQFKTMQAVSRGFGCEFTMFYQDETAGLLTSTAEKLGKITIGTELGHGQSVNYAGVEMAKRGILNAAIFSGQLKDIGLPEKIYSDQKLVDGSSARSSMLAPFDGIFEPCCDLGARVNEGDVVAILHQFDRIDEEPLEILASQDGYIITQAWEAIVQQGQTITLIAQLTEWSHS